MAYSPLVQELRRMTTGDVFEGELMGHHTSFRLGGRVDILVVPASIEDLEVTLDLAFRRGVPLLVMGGGTNLLVRDGGIRGIVLKIGRRLGHVESMGDVLRAGAGSPLVGVAKNAEALGLAGLEFATGIPGTLGGAVAMNAGAFSRCMGEVVESVMAIGPEGDKRTLHGEDLAMGYRDSIFRRTRLICVEACLRLKPGSPDEIRKVSQEYLAKRKQSQPWGVPSAGSVFKNPEGTSAGQLIEAAGLKGLRRGGAQISSVHANFIVNRGGASASDILALIDDARDAVYRLYGIQLDLEIGVVGEG